MPDSAAERALFANEAFYLAFIRKDVAAMDRLWATSVPVVCIHPGWPALVGREAVMQSWHHILGNADQPGIDFYNAVAVEQRGTFTVICYEELRDDVLVASNAFIEEGGELKLIHHQSAPCAHPPPLAGGS